MNYPRPPLTFLASCVATSSRNASLERIRAQGADIVLGTFRILKNSLVHAIDNAALQHSLRETHRELIRFADNVDGPVTLTFQADTIFVCGQLLRAPRSVYESALEVGRMLTQVGVAELAFDPDLTAVDLAQFCKAFAIAQREPARRDTLLNAQLSHVVVRAAGPTPTEHWSVHSPLAPLDRSLHTYAFAVTVVRQFLEAVAARRSPEAHQMKRVAQQLVQLAERHTLQALALTSLNHVQRDAAGRAVQSAILAIVIARRLTHRRATLSQLAMAAMTAPAAEIRLGGLNRLAPLSPDAIAQLPALGAAMAIAVAGITLANAQRATIAYETLYLEHCEELGPPYRGAITPMFQAKLLHAVRALLALRAPADGRRPLPMLDALAQLTQDRTIDPTVYRLLVSAIGLLPTGTVLEFENGQWGVVIGPSSRSDAQDQPRVKVLTDARGEWLSTPLLWDLGNQDVPCPRLRRIVDPEHVHFNVAAVLLTESS